MPAKINQQTIMKELIQDEVYNKTDTDLPLQTGTTRTAQAKVKHVASAVNTVGLKGSTGTNPVEIVAEGTGANLNVKLTPKGTGVCEFAGGGLMAEVHTGADSDLSLSTGVTKMVQALIKHVAGTIVNKLGIKGSATGSPVELAAEGTDTDIGVQVTPKGAGALVCSTGIQARKYAATATADGLTTGLIPVDTSWVEVTSADANNIVTLPALTAANAGMTIKVFVGANGCEMRTPATSGATINNVDSDGTNELALAANTHYICEGVAADTWVVRGFNNLGADLAALVPDAA